MSNPFAEQFLKAGVVSKQQVQKAQQDKNQKKKQQHNNKKLKPKENAAQLKAQKMAEEKAAGDRELNKRREDQARGKAVSAEINQLIKDNLIPRDVKCEISYNFEHQKKVKKIYINEDMKQQIIKGKLGIARIDGIYELVPIAVAEKIKQRNEKRVVIFEIEASKDENDPYADYEVPDDLLW